MFSSDCFIAHSIICAILPLFLSAVFWPVSSPIADKTCNLRMKFGCNEMAAMAGEADPKLSLLNNRRKT